MQLGLLEGDVVWPAGTDAALGKGLKGSGHEAVVVGPFAGPEVDILDCVCLLENGGCVQGVFDLSVEIGLAAEACLVVGLCSGVELDFDGRLG